MSKENVETKKSRKVLWGYVVGILSILIVSFFVYVLFVQNSLITYFIDKAGELTGYTPVFENVQALFVAIWEEFVNLVGVNGVYLGAANVDLTKLVSQLAVWIILAVFVVLFVAQVITFIKKKKYWSFIHTVIGVICAAIILAMVCLVSYLLTTDAGEAYFNAYTFSGTIVEGEEVFGWVTKILTVVIGLLAVIFVVDVFYLACYISIKSTPVEVDVEEEVPEETELPVGVQVGETSDDTDAALNRALNGMSLEEFIKKYALVERVNEYDVLNYEDARRMIEEEIRRAARDAFDNLSPREPSHSTTIIALQQEEAAANGKRDPKLSEGDVRDIIRSELMAAFTELNAAIDDGAPQVIREIPADDDEDEVKEKGPTVVKIIYEGHDGEETVEEKVIDDESNETIVIPAPKGGKRIVPPPTPVVAPRPMMKSAPPIKAGERGSEKNVQKGEILKQTFEERIVSGDEEIKKDYQTLKRLLMSYGLNSRVSTNGDTFRLAKKTYCKITMSGSALKIYLALDPKDYQHSAIPVNDASAKTAYQQIPLGFRVKSDLSLRRARDLVVDCMNQNGLTPHDDYVETDYVSELRKHIKELAKAKKK